MKYSVLLGIFVLLASGTAQGNEHPFTWVGIGTHRCGDYLNDRKKFDRSSHDSNHAKLVYEWTAGYLTGYASALSKTHPVKRLDGLTRANVLAYFDKYCHEYPLAYLVGGADSLAKELGL